MDDLKPVTHLLAIRITSKKGMKLLREGIHYLVILDAMTCEFLIGFLISSL